MQKVDKTARKSWQRPVKLVGESVRSATEFSIFRPVSREQFIEASEQIVEKISHLPDVNITTIPQQERPAVQLFSREEALKCNGIRTSNPDELTAKLHKLVATLGERASFRLGEVGSFDVLHSPRTYIGPVVDPEGLVLPAERNKIKDFADELCGYEVYFQDPVFAALLVDLPRDSHPDTVQGVIGVVRKAMPPMLTLDAPRYSMS